MTTDFLLFEGGARAPPEGVWGRSPHRDLARSKKNMGTLGPLFLQVWDIQTVSCPEPKTYIKPN